jgi:CRISPR-associated protein Cas1
MQLILETDNSYLRVKNGVFEIKFGEEVRQIAPEKLESIYITGHIQLSSEALRLALRYEIPVLVLNGSGEVLGRVWSHRFGSISTIRRQQVLYQLHARGTEWVCGNLLRKVQGQRQLLRGYARDRRSIADELQRMLGLMDGPILRLSELAQSGELLEKVGGQIRGYEGQLSVIYFDCINLLLPKTFQFAGRSRRPAKDPFNSVLNYIYGILYGRVESAICRAGLDPYLGFLHADEYNRPTLVYDVIEPYRVWGDAVALRLFTQGILSEGHFMKTESGGVGLTKAAKSVIIHQLNEYLQEVIQQNNMRRSRLTHLHQEMQQLANYLLKNPVSWRQAVSEPKETGQLKVLE